MESTSVGVHGPVGASENWPRGELDRSVIVIGDWAGWTAPVAFRSVSAIGPDGAPAASVCGALEKVSTGCVHVRNDFQTCVNDAPGTTALQVPVQASMPGSAGLVCCPESRIAAARRSRIARLWLT